MQTRILVALMALLVSCAGGSARTSRTYQGRGLPRPPVVLVFPFATNADEVVADSVGPDFHRPEPRTEQEREARQVADLVASEIVKALQKRRIPAERGRFGQALPLHAVLVRGQFLTIDEGSRVERMVIGFGAGSQELRIRAHAVQVMERGLLRLQEGLVEAHGDKLPGMAGPAAVGAAAGKASMIIVSAGANVAQEVKAGGLGGAAADVGEEIGDLAVQFFDRQGWRR